MWKLKNKKAQIGDFDFSEINPIAVAAGILGGAFAYGMMGNTGKLQVGLFWRIIAFAITGVLSYFVFSYIINKD